MDYNLPNHSTLITPRKTKSVPLPGSLSYLLGEVAMLLSSAFIMLAQVMLAIG